MLFGHRVDEALAEARQSDLPEAKWLSQLIPEGTIDMDMVLQLLIKDKSGPGYFYAHILHPFINESMDFLHKSMKLKYPLACWHTGIYQGNLDEYEWPNAFWFVALDYGPFDPQHYYYVSMYLKRCFSTYLPTNYCIALISPPNREVDWMIGSHIELTNDTIFGCKVDPPTMIGARKSQKFAYKVDKVARKSIIQWLLFAKRQRGLNKDVRKLIVKQVWRDRIEFVDVTITED